MLAFPGLLWLIVFITLCCSSQSSFFLLCSFTHVVYCKLFTHSMDGRHGDGSWMWWRESQVFLFGFSGVCVRMCVSRCFLCFGGKIPPLLQTSPTRPLYLFQTSSHPDTFTWAEESALPVSSNLPLLLKAPPSRFLTPPHPWGWPKLYAPPASTDDKQRARLELIAGQECR